jgi:hypothetical protein
MSTQLLIYENVVPLSKERHAKCSVEVGTDYAYTRKLNSLPLLATEFVQTAREFPIVFRVADNAIQPVVILGMKAEENLFIKADGQWAADYVPAFLRRYPFVFARSEDGKTFTLCIDESFTGFNTDGRGERLLTDDGQPTPYVNNVLKFLKTFETEHARTQAFCKRLDEFELLEPQNAVWTGNKGEKAALTGFHCVSREKMKAIPPKVLSSMIGTGELDLIYAHFLSLQNFNQFKNKLAADAGQETAPPAKKKKK